MSIVEIILAVRAGLRNAVQMTMWPRRTRSVSAASAASEVNDSNVISSVGRGTVWKWSNSQIDSNPSRSAWRATSVVRRHASSGSQPSYSPTQPWGTIAPIFMTVCHAETLDRLAAEGLRTADLVRVSDPVPGLETGMVVVRVVTLSGGKDAGDEVLRRAVDRRRRDVQPAERRRDQQAPSLAGPARLAARARGIRPRTRRRDRDRR